MLYLRALPLILIVAACGKSTTAAVEGYPSRDQHGQGKLAMTHLPVRKNLIKWDDLANNNQLLSLRNSRSSACTLLARAGKFLYTACCLRHSWPGKAGAPAYWPEVGGLLLIPPRVPSTT